MCFQMLTFSKEKENHILLLLLCMNKHFGAYCLWSDTLLGPPYRGEGLGPVSTSYARLCGLPMGSLTLSEKWIRGWVEEGGQGRRRRGRGKCGWYVK